MSFEWVLQKVLSVEGGYVNDRVDPGGETYMGISRVYHPEWPGWSILDNASSDIDTERLKKEVDHFYKTNYWVPLKLEQVSAISRETACRMMNIAVHKSRYWAVLWLQEGLNLLNIDQRLYPNIVEDGLIGPRTLESLTRYFTTETPTYRDKVDMLTGIMRTLQSMSYIESMKKYPEKEKYRGWFLRAEKDSCR